MTDTIRQIHATAISLDDGRCALILGSPGSGKSDLALRCILQGAWIDGRHCLAILVADDQVLIERRGDELLAQVPAPIAGRIEVRGIGIVGMAHKSSAKIALTVELADSARIERLPDPPPSWSLLGVEVPLIRVAPFETSAHLKVMLALSGGSRKP